MSAFGVTAFMSRDFPGRQQTDLELPRCARCCTDDHSLLCLLLCQRHSIEVSTLFFHLYKKSTTESQTRGLVGASVTVHQVQRHTST